MGILRTDRVAGLGGANAIKGSVFFNKQPSSFLRTEIDDTDFVLGTDDFTLELWHNTPTLSTTNGLIMFGPGGYGYYNSFFHFSTADVVMYISSNGSSWDIASGTKIGERKINTWHHFALTREGNTFRGFVDGVLGATFTSSGSIRQGSSEFNMNQIIIGHRITTTLGHISNFRYIKGRAVYTAAFTPPSYELNVTSDTILLCCQSPSNVLQEATGKTLILEAGGSSNAVSAATNIGPPIATKFTPNSPVGFSTTTDVGTQFGSTFDGVTTFDSQAYMVPPGGNTRERNRGRAVFGGGYAGGPSPAGAETAEMSFLQIQSQGNSLDFGDLTAARWIPASCSSSTRGTWSGGATPSRVNTIDFVTIANTSNATDFGDLTGTRTYFDACSNQTRGITGAGDDGSTPKVNTMDLIIIATAGNASDFGDATAAKSNVVSTSSPTRGLLIGGSTPTTINNVDFITIATTGNAQDFGDMTAPTQYGGGSSSNTRAVYAGGHSPDGSTYSNKIEFFTIASAGNGTDFGDLITARVTASGSTSNGTRGVIAGGFTPSRTFNLNSIEFYTIATTGNAQDFGDITNSKRGIGACSDSHGGLE